MAAVPSLGHSPFVTVKTALTALGVAVLCLHQQWALSRAGLGVVLGGYAGLAMYHAVMQSLAFWNE
jgi:hypothetical protein